MLRPIPRRDDQSCDLTPAGPQTQPALSMWCLVPGAWSVWCVVCGVWCAVPDALSAAAAAAAAAVPPV